MAEDIEMSDPQRSDTPDQEGGREEGQRFAHRISLPGFIKEEVGLGDVIKRATYAAGIRPCAGCRRRAAAFNRWLVFSPRGRR